MSGDKVSIKNCTSTDMKSRVTSRRDVSDGLAGTTTVDVKNGHYGGQRPYFSQYPRRFHQSKPLPYYYSTVSTSIGVQNETVSGSVSAKNDPKSSSTSMKQNSYRNAGGLTRTLSKTTTNYTKEEIEILNKAPDLHSNFTAQRRSYSNQTGNINSSLANSRSHPTNYRPNYYARVSNYNVNDRFMSGENFRSRESEKGKEVTRGPRCHKNSVHPESSSSSVVKDEFSVTLLCSRDEYNLPDFETEYEAAKFYMIKSFNEDDIHKGIKYGVWTSTPNGNKKLNAAFHVAEAKLSETGINCPVFLFFSVNGSGQFVGVAEMLGPVDFKKDMKFWKLDKYNGFFPIKWHIIKDVPNRHFHHITLQNNENKCVTFSRDTQEIGLKEGLQMLTIFKGYSAKTCLLDDFDFYEKRDKVHHFQRVTESSSSSTEQLEVNNNNYSNVRKREMQMQSSGSKQINGLSNLTKNLSLNPSAGGFR